ncbi:MAG: 6,7-dimethyl-8-ribityllumazine synthase [Bacteroidales bacterium]|nr:6,7-dimethyl-8-ribityllumazine synthase [Bacteroidales bacterium]
MSTKDTNLSSFDNLPKNSGKGLTIGIVVAEWNHEITNALYNGAKETLEKYGAKVATIKVPGTVELTFGAGVFMETNNYDSVIVLGCVVRGETPHFDYVCQSVTLGITELNLENNIPIIFGVLTTENQQQALDRAGGKHGNKGVECAVAAIKMALLEIE